jgi:hypothetical protein
MNENEIRLIIGGFFIVLLINTMMIFSFSSLMAGQRSQTAVNASCPPVVTVPGNSALAALKPDPTPVVPATAAIAGIQPATTPAAQDPVATPAVTPPDTGLPAVPEFSGQAEIPGASIPTADPAAVVTPVADPAAAATPAPDPVVSAVPVAGIPANTDPVYVTIGPAEPVPIEQHEMIQAEIPRIPMEGYIQIYSLRNQNLSSALNPVYFNLVNPPLIIDYDITPMNITDEKYVEYKTLDTEHYQTWEIIRPYEQTWARITVRDRDTGQIVSEDDFGKLFGLQSPRQMVIRQSGNYKIEFAGDFATMNLTMEAKREGNIE